MENLWKNLWITDCIPLHPTATGMRSDALSHDCIPLHPTALTSGGVGRSRRRIRVQSEEADCFGVRDAVVDTLENQRKRLPVEPAPGAAPPPGWSLFGDPDDEGAA